MQKEMLAVLSEAWDRESYCRKLQEARMILDRYLERLEDGKVNTEELVISKRLTRAPCDYQKASMSAIAAQQLDGCGTKLRPGEAVRYVITNSKATIPNERVRAYALWDGCYGYDRKKYREILQEAFEPFSEPSVRDHQMAR